MIEVVNPVYCSVYEYLLEDGHISKTLLSSFLEKAGLAGPDSGARLCESTQFVDLDEEAYMNDKDMRPIVFRLAAATLSSKVRCEMDVEYEFYTAIEKRDMEIERLNRLIAEKEKILAEIKQIGNNRL